MNCPDCKGAGKVTCSHCFGAGIKKDSTMFLLLHIPLLTSCNDCGETGKERCTRCGGSGQIPDK